MTPLTLLPSCSAECADLQLRLLLCDKCQASSSFSALSAVLTRHVVSRHDCRRDAARYLIRAHILTDPDETKKDSPMNPRVHLSSRCCSDGPRVVDTVDTPLLFAEASHRLTRSAYLQNDFVEQRNWNEGQAFCYCEIDVTHLDNIPASCST